MTKDPFKYHAPTEITAPRYRAIREAEAVCWANVDEVLKRASTLPRTSDNIQPIFDRINDACRAFWIAIEDYAPNSADKSAALRCVRIARMAANEIVVTNSYRFLRQVEWNLQLARMQACAAIALADEGDLSPTLETPS